MFRNQTAQRIIAAIVLTTFSSLALYPLSAAAQAKDAMEKAGVTPRQKDEGIIDNAKRFINGLGGKNKAAVAQHADERFAQLLVDIHEDLKAIVPHTALSKEARDQHAGKTSARDPAPSAVNGKSGMDTRAIGPDIQIETERGKAGIIQLLPGTDIAAKVKNIRGKAAEIKRHYPDIEQSFKDTEQHLKKAKLPQEILDRHNNAVAQYESRKAEFERLMSKVEQAHDNGVGQQAALADLGSFMTKYKNAKQHQYTDPNKLPFRSPDGKVRKPFETKAQYQASLFPPTYEKVMLAGAIPDGLQLAQATLPAIPNAADLAETEDVQITPAIRELAAQLNHHPVKIYNYVRNSIQFIPSYGSIQGAEMTLQNKRGNAFDTASLLISLLRASGIAARFVYGTIEIPADKVMNWLGGVTKPEAAQSLLGQGGIPNVGLVSGGAVKAFRMEHVWVEAYVDYVPSRGEKNFVPDTWVPLDASFKQYQFTSGMDVKSNVPFDSQALLEQAKQDALVNNETEGWIQTLNLNSIQAQLGDYQTQIKTYIDSQKADATVGDVLGTQTIIQENHRILLGSLPYKTVIIADKFQRLPSNLQLKATFNLYNSEIDKANQIPAFTHSLNFSQIGAKRLAITYVPATEADRQLLKQYSENEAKALPSYLIQQKAQLRLDETTLAEHVAQQMGQVQYWTYTLSLPGGTRIEEDFKAESSVGDEIVFSTNGNGIAPAQVESRYLAVNPNTSLENLHHLALGYWARADFSDALMAKQSGHVAYRQPSVGMFTQPLSVRYYFGIPRLASYKSYLIDIRRLSQSATKVDSGATPVEYNIRSGMKNSYLEGAVIEEVFDEAKGTAMSAVAVLNEAVREGVPLWELNSNNLMAYMAVTALPLSVRQQINNAIAAGLTVYAPEGRIDLGFWSGQGYIAIDPASGAGAYIVSNGANGGEFEACEEKKQPLQVSIAERVLTYAAIALAAVILATAVVYTAGGALPVAMKLLGLTALTFSATSYAAGKCKSNEKCHRGSLQAQGGDIKDGVGQNKGLTKSEAWAQPTPLALSQGLAKLESLKAQLTASQLAAREEYFQMAEDFMRKAALAGGVCADIKKSFPRDNQGGYSNEKHKALGIRVDINVNAGQAFTP